ncbi:MAG: protein kinase [Thermoanaerobaculia bacterium]
MAPSSESIASFEILGLLGDGGMGRVYRARDPRLGREVAVKLLHERFRNDVELLQRFESEARSASALSHPNIVTIHEIGDLDDEGPFIVMELVKGRSLREILLTSEIAPKEALRIAEAIADGLAAAHEKGIVHRDLKPENVMITPDGRVKILDFGLAKLAESGFSDQDETLSRSPHHTLPGSIIGTPAYMSPEQASGASADYRSDQFSLGAILYEMLAGWPAFRRATGVETMTAIIREEPEPLQEVNPSLSADVVRIVERCLSKSPQERYASTVDLLHDIRSVSAQLSTARVTPTGTRWIRRVRSHRRAWLKWLLILLVAGSMAATLVLVRQRSATPQVQIPAAEPAVLAVLPFSDLTGDPEGKRLAAGLSELVAGRLTALSDIQIVSPASAARIAEDRSLPSIAHELGATRILKAAVARSNERIRLTFAVIDPFTGIQITSDSVDGDVSDLFGLEDSVSESILRSMRLATRETAPRHSTSGLTAPLAQEHYLQAVGSLQQYENEASVDHAIALLSELRGEAGDSALLDAALGRAFLYKYNLTHDRSLASAAEEYCRRAVRLDPHLMEAHVTVGELYTTLGRFKEAIWSFERALQLRKGSPEAILGLAVALDKSGQDVRAEVAYREAIAARPKYWAGYNKFGAYYFHRNRYSEAKEMFRRATEANPENYRPYANLGGTQFAIGEYEEAIGSLKHSIQLHPNGLAWSNLGTAYLLAERYPEAANAFENATSLEEKRSSFWRYLGDSYRWSEQKEKASAAYAEAIRLAREELLVNRTDAKAHVTIGASLAKTGHPLEAESEMKLARRLLPKDGHVLFVSGIVTSLAGDRDEAIHYLQQALAAGYEARLIRDEPELKNVIRDPRLTKVLD